MDNSDLPLSLPYGGIGKRFFASVVDGLILSVVSMAIGYFGMRWYLADQIATLLQQATQQAGSIPSQNLFAEENPVTSIAQYYLIVTGATVVLNWLYFAVLESRRGATFGKSLLGLHVTDLDGAPISFTRASVRFFMKIPSGMILLLGYIMAFFTEKKQALHDLVAGTLVLDAHLVYAGSFSRTDLASTTFDGGMEAHDVIDLNKDPYEHGFGDHDHGSFGATQTAEPEKPVPTRRGIDEFGEGVGRTAVRTPDADVHAAFGMESEQAAPATPPSIPVPGKSIPRPSVVPTTATAPVAGGAGISGRNTLTETAKPVATPGVPPATVQQPSGSPKSVSGQAGRSCPSCGAAVGQYQTQCMRCHASLKGGVSKKLFGR